MQNNLITGPILNYNAIQAYAVSNSTAFRRAKESCTKLAINKGRRFPDYRAMSFPKGTALVSRTGVKVSLKDDYYHAPIFSLAGNFYFDGISNDRHNMNILGNHDLNSKYLLTKTGQPRMHHTTYDVPFVGNMKDSSDVINHAKKIMAGLETIAAERCVDDSAFRTKSHPVVFFRDGNGDSRWYSAGYDVVVICPEAVATGKFDNSMHLVIIVNPYNAYSGNWLDVGISGTITKMANDAASALRDKSLAYLALLTKSDKFNSIVSHHDHCPGAGRPEGIPVNKPVIGAVVGSDLADPSIDLSKVNFTMGDPAHAFARVESPFLFMGAAGDDAAQYVKRNASGVLRRVPRSVTTDARTGEAKFSTVGALPYKLNVGQFDWMSSFFERAFSLVDPDDEASEPFYSMVDATKVFVKDMAVSVTHHLGLASDVKAMNASSQEIASSQNGQSKSQRKHMSPISDAIAAYNDR